MRKLKIITSAKRFFALVRTPTQAVRSADLLCYTRQDKFFWFQLLIVARLYCASALILWDDRYSVTLLMLTALCGVYPLVLIKTYAVVLWGGLRLFAEKKYRVRAVEAVETRPVVLFLGIETALLVLLGAVKSSSFGIGMCCLLICGLYGWKAYCDFLIMRERFERTKTQSALLACLSGVFSLGIITVPFWVMTLRF